jgi:hypothetical protein
VIRTQAVASIDAFEHTCKALNLEPTEADYDQLLEDITATVNNRTQAASRYLQQELSQVISGSGFLSSIPDQIASQTIRDCSRRVERLKLEAKNRTRVSTADIPAQIAVAMSEVNSQARCHLGHSIFQVSEPRAFVDIGQAPSTPEELSHRLQALGILIDQMDQETFVSLLTNICDEVPEGGINRLEAVMRAKGFRIPSAAIARLRDLRRLRNLYPSHPNDKQALDAARRLNIDPKSKPEIVWEQSLRACLSALTELSQALAEGPASSD